MTLPYPPLSTDFVLEVVMPAAIAVVGILAAARRAPGHWRTLLIGGLVAWGLLPALWWWGWRDDSRVGFGWFGKSDPDTLDRLLRAQWIDLLLVAGALLGSALVVCAALMGRSPGSGDEGADRAR